MATGLATLAWIRQAQGDASGALDAMEEAQGVGVSPDVVALMNPVPALRARLLLARGEIDEAADWAGERASPSISPAIPGELEYLVLVRVLLAQQEYDRTLGLVRMLRSDASNQRRTNSVIELQALEALALAAGGDESARWRSCPRRSASRSRRATSVSSSTRARRWPNWSANSLLPS